MPRSLIENFEEQFGVRIVQGWGMTETSPLAAVSWPPKGVEPGTVEETDWRVKSGRVIAGVELRIVGDDGTVLPWDGDAVGEVQVRGPWVTGSYYRDPDPLKFDDGWLRTGDIASVTPNGYIQITDRSKDVIKSGGEWISSVELEVLLMAHPGVIEAAVIAVPDPRWEERPLACVVRRSDSGVSADELREFLSEGIARWQLPERWAFIEEVPKTSVGKFDKKVLRARYADGVLVVEELSVKPVPSLAAMTPTLAESVFDRLGGDLWLLDPRVRVLGARGHLRRPGARESDDRWPPARSRESSGSSSEWRCRCLIANERGNASEGFARNLFLFALFGAMAAAVWIEFLSRPGMIARAQTGLASVPHPLRSLRRRGGAWRATRRSHASRCATVSARRSVSVVTTTCRRTARGRPTVRRLRLSLEQCGGMFVKLGQILSTRSDLLSPGCGQGALAAPGPRAAGRAATTSPRCSSRSSTLRSTKCSPPSTGSRSPRRRSARCTGRRCPTGRRSSSR